MGLGGPIEIGTIFVAETQTALTQPGAGRAFPRIMQVDTRFDYERVPRGDSGRVGSNGRPSILSVPFSPLVGDPPYNSE